MDYKALNTKNDRRGRDRIHPLRTVPAIVTKMEAFREVGDIEVKDLSEKGICFVFPINPNALYIRDSLHFELDLGPAGHATLNATPRYILRNASGRYELGLELAELTNGARGALSRYLGIFEKEDSEKS